MAGRALKNMLYDDGYRFLPFLSFPFLYQSINAYVVVVYWMDG